MFCSCEHLYLIWLSLSSAVVFQVLTAAAGICSVDFTVTLISITVHTTTKLKLLTRFAKRTPWLLPTRSREYEEDSVWLWILGAVGFKKMDLSPTFFLKDLFLCPVVCYTFRIFSPVHDSSHMFSAFHSCLCVSLTFFFWRGCAEETRLYMRMGGGTISVTEWDCWRKSYCHFRKCCWWLPDLFCDPPRHRLDYAWK